jgi:hypothetical protein
MIFFYVEDSFVLVRFLNWRLYRALALNSNTKTCFEYGSTPNITSAHWFDKKEAEDVSNTAYRP